MKYIVTKNLNKKEDKHPDFKLYQKDINGEVIMEEYQKKDGTTGQGWKSFGALWIKKENGEIKSMSISIDDDKAEQPQPQAQKEVVHAEEHINPEDIPF